MANSFQQEQEKPEFARISELAENIVLRLPGCDDVMIRKSIQEVYREFCRETKCLTAERPIEIEPGCAEYPVSSMFGGVVTGIRAVAIGVQRLKHGVDYSTVGTKPLVVVLAPRWVGEELPRVPLAEAHIHAAPRVMRIVQEEVPALNSEKTPPGFIEKYGEAICSGVLARLCSMLNRPWSDAQVAALERVNYENAKSEERMRRETPPGGRFIDTSQIL